MFPYCRELIRSVDFKDGAANALSTKIYVSVSINCLAILILTSLNIKESEAFPRLLTFTNKNLQS